MSPPPLVGFGFGWGRVSVIASFSKHEILRIRIGIRLTIWVFVSPSNSISIFPFSFSHLPKPVREHASPMLLAESPPSVVSCAIRLRVDTFAVLLVFFILSFIVPSIRPRVMTVSAYHIVFPIAFVDSSIRPVALPLSVYHIVVPIAFVHRIVLSWFVNTVPLSLAFMKYTFICWAIRLILFAFTMMQIILPVAFVNLTIFVNVSSKSIGSILEERTCILISIRMIKNSFSLQYPIPPITLIISPIDPFLLAFAMLYLEFFIFFDNDFHLSRVHRSITLLINSNILKLCFFLFAEFIIVFILLVIVERLPFRALKLVAKLIVLLFLIGVFTVAHVDQRTHYFLR